MATKRRVTCVIKKSIYNEPHERIEGIGGDYLGVPWMLPQTLVIHYIKRKIEAYYISVNNKAIKIIIAYHNGREYLKTETDGYSPDNLLALPEFS
jgi:hypothetical protein